MSENPLLSCNNVGVRFHEKTILKDITFSLTAQRIVTLIGPNGAGKTTLVRVLLGLQKPTTGTLIKAKNLTFGYVPQKVTLNPLLPMTVQRFLQLVPQPVLAFEQVCQWLSITALRSQQIYRLSGGEWQRVLLARALLRCPDILVLDEPLQGIDMTGQRELYQLISEIRERLHCSILLISHDLNLVMSMTDMVICLNKSICCSGPPQHLVEQTAFQDLFGSHVAYYQHKHDLSKGDSLD